MSDEAFTHDELIAALTAAQPATGEDDPAAMTVRELVTATGRGDVVVARRLRGLIDAGLVEVVRRPWTRIDGARTTVPAYRLMKKG